MALTSGISGPFYRPSGWQTTDSATAWIAFGSALPLRQWDQKIYTGASNWPDYTPKQFLEILDATAAGENDLRNPLLRTSLQSVARANRWPGYDTHDPAETHSVILEMEEFEKDVKQIAQLAASELRTNLPVAVERLRAIEGASDTLRRLFASGKLAAYGWKGDHSFRPGARERLSPDLFDAPVLITPDGVLPFPLGFGRHTEKFTLVCNSVLIDSQQLLDIRPPENTPEQLHYVTYEDREGGRQQLGGRPPKHDWDAFWIEVAKYTAANDLDPDHRADLQRHMETWTGEKWIDPPDPSTIRRRLARLYRSSASK